MNFLSETVQIPLNFILSFLQLDIQSNASILSLVSDMLPFTSGHLASGLINISLVSSLFLPQSKGAYTTSCKVQNLLIYWEIVKPVNIYKVIIALCNWVVRNLMALTLRLHSSWSCNPVMVSQLNPAHESTRRWRRIVGLTSFHPFLPLHPSAQSSTP